MNKIIMVTKRLLLNVSMIQLFWLNLINTRWVLKKIQLQSMKLSNGNQKLEHLEKEKSLSVKDLVNLGMQSKIKLVVYLILLLNLFRGLIIIHLLLALSVEVVKVASIISIQVSRKLKPKVISKKLKKTITKNELKIQKLSLR